MKTDLAGNVYSTSGGSARGEVRITAPDGKRLGVLQMPQRGGEPRQQVCATNVAFGDADVRTLVRDRLHGRVSRPAQDRGHAPWAAESMSAQGGLRPKGEGKNAPNRTGHSLRRT